MRTDRLAMTLASAALLTVVLAGCTSSTQGRNVPALPAASQPSSLLIVPADQRPAAPEVSGPTLDGSTLDLADLRGEIVALNAFASWCPPCQEEMPVFADVAKRWDGVRVIGLDVMDHAEAAIGTLKAVGADYPVIVDPQGDLMARFTGEAARGLPVTFFIDAQGRVAGRILGPASASMLRQAIDEIGATTRSP